MSDKGWNSTWGLIGWTTISDLPDGRVLVRIATGPLAVPGREVEYGWTPLPEGPPPAGDERWYTLRPARDGAEVVVRIEGRDGLWEVEP